MSGSRKHLGVRDRANRTFTEVRDQYSSEWATIDSMAAKLGSYVADPVERGALGSLIFRHRSTGTQASDRVEDYQRRELRRVTICGRETGVRDDCARHTTQALLSCRTSLPRNCPLLGCSARA